MYKILKTLICPQLPQNLASDCLSRKADTIFQKTMVFSDWIVDQNLWQLGFVPISKLFWHPPSSVLPHLYRIALHRITKETNSRLWYQDPLWMQSLYPQHYHLQRNRSTSRIKRKRVFNLVVCGKSIQIPALPRNILFLTKASLIQWNIPFLKLRIAQRNHFVKSLWGLGTIE